jgi:hypothetical protein
MAIFTTALGLSFTAVCCGAVSSRDSLYMKWCLAQAAQVYLFKGGPDAAPQCASPRFGPPAVFVGIICGRTGHIYTEFGGQRIWVEVPKQQHACTCT